MEEEDLSRADEAACVEAAKNRPDFDENSFARAIVNTINLDPAMALVTRLFGKTKSQ